MNDQGQSRSVRPIVSLALLLIGTLLVGFSIGRWLAPLAAWVGPVLVMRYARDHKAGRGYPLVLIACIVSVLIGFLSIWLEGLPRPLVPFLVVGIGLLWSLPYLADRLISPRLRGFAGTFAFPLAATTLELLFIYFNPLGAWGAWGFTQYGILPLMQIASVTGMIGITFLMGWFASVANWAWENHARIGEIRWGVVSVGTVLAGVFIFGYLRLNLSPVSATDETIRVAAIIPAGLDALSNAVADSANEQAIELAIQAHWDTYLEATKREAQAGARVIVWPEGAGVALDTYEPSVARAQEVALEYGIYLAVPVFTQPHDKSLPYENTLLLIDPTGAIAMQHHKYGGALVEGNRVAGDRTLKTVDSPFGTLSGVICYDLDYPAVIRQTGVNGTGLLLVPSRDWLEIDPVHSHMAVFRAIENGMSIVRNTDRGLSIAVDPYGRVLAQTDYFGANDRTLVAQVPVRDVATIYARFGRWFEWISLAGFLLVIGLAVVARRQAS